MNSKQGSRYIKRRMGKDLKNQILVHNGIITEESAVAERKPSVLSCARCSLVNAVDNQFCSKCSYPLTPQAYEEIKAEENGKLKAMEQKVALLNEAVLDMQQLLKDPEKVAEIVRAATRKYKGKDCQRYRRNRHYYRYCSFLDFRNDDDDDGHNTRKQRPVSGFYTSLWGLY